MSSFDFLMQGMVAAAQPMMLLYALIGVTLGTAVGVLPGIGPALTVVSGLKGDLPRPPRQAPAPLLWIMGGLVGQLALLHVAGFVISGAVLFGMTARGFGQKPLWRNLLVGYALAFVIYGVFDRLLKLNLPGGPLEMLIFRG